MIKLFCFGYFLNLILSNYSNFAITFQWVHTPQCSVKMRTY